MRKICLVMTSRGNYGKLKSVISAVTADPELELNLVVGGSLVLDKYGKVLDSEYVELPTIDRQVRFVIEGENLLTMAKSAGLAMMEFAEVFERLQPDVVVVIADRFECLPIAAAAAYMNICVAHIEGGEISGSIDESVRHAITKMAHLHFPATEEARERIIRLGEDSDRVWNVGATSLDALALLDLDSIGGVIEFQKYHGVGEVVELIHGKYLVVIQHPVTTEYDRSYQHIGQTIEAIHQLSVPTAWIWPNMDAGSDAVSKAVREYREELKPRHVQFFKSLPIELFGPLLNNAGCLVGNSSSGIREAAFLGVPVVNIGSRQDGRRRGKNVVTVPNNKQEIVDAIKRQLASGRFDPDHFYGDGMAAPKIVDVLRSGSLSIQKMNFY